jgi:hypothetical protein
MAYIDVVITKVLEVDFEYLEFGGMVQFGHG